MKNFLYFIAGAAIGSAVAWKLTKDYCDKKNEEDIRSVKEVFARRYKVEDTNYNNDEQVEEKHLEKNTSPHAKEPVSSIYEKLINKNTYATRSNYLTSTEKPKNEPEENDGPYVLENESEFGLFDDYEAITLNYYADGVLTDDQDIPVDDYDIVGNALDRFDNENVNEIYGRNDARKCDYEIIRCTEEYEDIITD